jgi:hypothetical protein
MDEVDGVDEVDFVDKNSNFYASWGLVAVSRCGLMFRLRFSQALTTEY